MAIISAKTLSANTRHRVVAQSSTFRAAVMAANSLKRVSSTDGSISPPNTKRRITTTATTTTTKGAIANFFQPLSKQTPPKVTFQIVQDSLLTASYSGASETRRLSPLKIAAFDLDDTIITTKSGTRFARDEFDWKWWHAGVPERLRQLNAEGFTIVFISNQAGISLKPGSKTPKGDMKSLSKFKAKVVAVLNALELPIGVYAATEKDLFRKPRTGMWERMLHDHGVQTAEGVTLAGCFFVGDAGGREAGNASNTRKDHSCSDRDFAANVGILFHTPEEYFLGKAVMPFLRSFNPVEYVRAVVDSDPQSSPTAMFNKKSDLELVLFCGSPGSGKSTYYWRQMQPLGYERVNQDILKTRPKCLRVAAEYLGDGKSVVVDNTNADVETRAEWITLAQKFKVPIRLVLFTASPKLCEHNDVVRALSSGMMNPEKRTMLPKLAFTGFASRYRAPKTQEGFEDITTVDFNFEGTEDQKSVWTKFWIS